MRSNGSGAARLRLLELSGREPRTTVFVHGLGSAGVPAFGEIADVVPGRRLVPDLLGFGFSDRPSDFGYTLVEHADALARVLDDRAVEGADLVGHSLGGSIAVVLAERRPDLVRRLVVLEPNLDPWDGDASVQVARQSQDAFLDHGFDALIGSADPDWTATLRVSDPVALYRTSVGLCEGPERTIRELLTELELPRTYVYGERTGPPSDVDGLLAAGVVVRRVDDAGHVMTADNPDGVVDVLVDALDIGPSPS